MIKKVAEGCRVVREKGKNLGGPYKTKKEAEKRLKQVEYFKHSRHSMSQGTSLLVRLASDIFASEPPPLWAALEEK